MQILEGVAKVLAFRTLPTTVLTALVYVALFAAVLFTDRVPGAPKNQRGLDLTQAYADLHQITARPHPFISHANDMVHSYILERLRNATAGIDHVEIYDDLVSNASWASWSSSAFAVYNEATNILVKIQGSDPEYSSTGGALFSAHYDSVATASGTTDDGMGVATLMQLIEYLAKNRPKRTAVFNINNGEEDGLNGAFTFLKHPWSNLTDTFLNLEGAAAGGRPLLFRGTSTHALRAFHVPHPHGNVLSADAFSRGVVRSGTDYTVYTGAGMDGLDLAFYKGRSKYHTKYDAIPYTDGQERALWAMMESAQSSGLALLNNDKTHGTGDPPVYFDLFGAWMVLLPLHYLFVSNVLLLIVGPLILMVLLAVEAAIFRGGREIQNGHSPESGNLLQRFWNWLIGFGWLQGGWIWAKFWASVVVTIGLQALLVFGYLKVNPYIMYSRPSLVLVSSFTLAYLSLVFVVTPSSNHLPEKQKHTMLVQTYVFTWILLVVATVAANSGIGGVYFVTAWNFAVLLACVVGCIENMVGAQGFRDPPRRFFRRMRYDALPQRDEEHRPAVAEPATEATPLIQSFTSTAPTQDESGAIGWWIVQLILAVAVPITLVAHIGVVLIGALAQTLSDGSSAATVYQAVSLVAFMLVLPVVPFTFKIHSWVASTFIIIFVLTTLSGMLFFPFSQQEPMKVSFQQSVALGNISSPNRQITHATTTVSGLDYYVPDLVLAKFPSALGQHVNCSEGSAKAQGLTGCSWDSDLLPFPGAVDSNRSADVGADRWLKASAKRLNATSARFLVGGANTRGCRLYFDNTRIKHYYVHGSEPGMLPQFSGPPDGTGFAALFLWSRTWDRTFTVDVDWEGEGDVESTLEGRVSCVWAEYESGSVGVDTYATGKIPAFEEVLSFLPNWVTVSFALVEAWGSFSI
ncbi:putative zinc metalloprotease [Mycena pura]|uniref:Peptide hydrolase n=1 Tax=Mycena pura TaxID=153505 RepID=A0AAD6VM09_9AGAR|nr:putative zinc metalloprotease [Mycena pura]